MSLLSIAAKYFGLSELSDQQRTALREEINLMDAINAHLKWKSRLQDYLDGKSAETLDPMIICRDDQCALGKWIHSKALHHFHGSEKFRQLREDHAQFHYVAANVVRNVQSANIATADALLKGEYQHASRKVVQALTSLNQEVSG